MLVAVKQRTKLLKLMALLLRIGGKSKERKKTKGNALKVLPVEVNGDTATKSLSDESLRLSKTAVVPSPERQNSNLKAKAKIHCPQCRAIVPVKEWISTFVSSECCVCFETHKMRISTVCGHGVCSGCFDQLQKNAKFN